MMFLHISALTIANYDLGPVFRADLKGLRSEKASGAATLTIMLIQKSCMADRVSSPVITTPIGTNRQRTTMKVTWYWRYFRILSTKLRQMTMPI